MGKLIDAMERLVFGKTAQERVDMVVELAARRVEERLAAALERITADEPDPDEHTDYQPTRWERQQDIDAVTDPWSDDDESEQEGGGDGG